MADPTASGALDLAWRVGFLIAFVGGFLWLLGAAGKDRLG